MGGGTGTGSAPVIAQIAKRMGALTVAVVTRPFEFEGPLRKKLAFDGIEKLRSAVDALIVIPNEKLLAMVDRRTSIIDTFVKAEDVLRQSVQAISNLILETGIINIDFADAEAIMRDQGDTLMSIADGDGDNRAALAAKKALDNPLLEDTSIKGATKVLIYVAGNTDMAMAEYQEVVSTVTADVDENAEIKAGLYIDPSLEDKIRVTVIATGFEAAMKIQAENVQNMDGAKDDKGDYIKEDEFKKMIGGGFKPKVDFQPRRNNYQEDDLDVPTYLRDKKFNGNISVMPRASSKEA
jgi:cell division protein FtsZ